MKYLFAISFLLLIFGCKKDFIAEKGINLDVVNAITIDENQNFGVTTLPSDAGTEIIKYFDKYTRVVAENGKFIHLFAPSEVTEYELARMREVLIGILSNYPNSTHGDDKSSISNFLADENSCVMILMNAADIKKISEGILLVSPIGIHPILFDQIIPEGSSGFLNTTTVDKSMSKLMRMVLKTGIANTNFGFNSEIYNASNSARNNGTWNPSNIDTLTSLGDLGLEYISIITEVYYGKWEQLGTVNNGEYIYSTRTTLASDGLGLSGIESFFPSNIPYKVILDPSFSGDFTLTFDLATSYTLKSQYYSILDISASNCLNITGNAYSNLFTGNSLDNTFEGKQGDDNMDGSTGFDIALFSGVRNDYLIFSTNDGIAVVQDTVPNRDGLDSLVNFERLQFTDIVIDL